ISFRQFLPLATPADFPFPTADGRHNLPPVVKVPLANIVAKSTDVTTVDLAGAFSDPDITDNLVRLDTSAGPITLELFDQLAPKTVANFLSYVVQHRYDNTIFERLSSGFVLQGGGFTFQDNPSRLTPVTQGPALVNEGFSLPNTLGTLAMAE